MFRFVSITCVSLALVGMFGGASAQDKVDAEKFVGKWKGNADGYEEIWLIKKADDKWSISGSYSKNKKFAGTFIGKDVRLDGAKLVFTQTLSKKRPPGWHEIAKITVELDGDNLKYIWEAADQKGETRILKK